MKLLSFDLEVAALNLDDGGDWKSHRPLGITCASCAWIEDGAIKIETVHGFEGDRPAPRMMQWECQTLVDKLMEVATDGYTILTWNGNFDFDILAEESGMHAECVELAMHSCDPCFFALCSLGYPIGLDAACKGMGLPGKPEGMTGAKAPELWTKGEYQVVLDYVAGDVKSTLSVALEVEKRKSLSWITRSGKLRSLPVERWLTVEQCLSLPEPDTSWMQNPLTRTHFLRWMTEPRPVV